MNETVNVLAPLIVACTCFILADAKRRHGEPGAWLILGISLINTVAYFFGAAA